MAWIFIWYGLLYPYSSRVVGRATCGWWTMPPNMEKFYDPQFDLGDEDDKESFQFNSEIDALWNL